MIWMELGRIRMEKSDFNLPNFLTVLRVLLVPFFIYFLIQDDFFFRLYALVIFLLASFTDLIDGYLARKWKQETEFGKFLDPLADKILVIGSFMTFILLDKQIELWMVLLIILRDMLITSLRWLAIQSGTSLHTTMMGKIKTAFQMGAIFVILVLFMAVSTKQRNVINSMYEQGEASGKSGYQIAYENYSTFMNSPQEFTMNNFNWVDSAATFLPYYVMLITTIVTVFSGLRYIFTNYELLNPFTIIKLIRRKN